jgi:hypothetical protein
MATCAWTTRMSEKPHLCLALLHDYAARDFLDSGVLDELAQNFRLSFLSGARLTLDLSRYGHVSRYREPSGWRLRTVLLARALWHMHDKRGFEFNRQHALRRATFGFGPTITRAVDVLSAIGLALVGAQALRLLLRCTTPESFPRSKRPDAVLVYTSVNSYFADDLVRETKRKSMPLLALTNNWDNINTKSFLETPPYLAVWGEQGFLIARLMHRISPHRIFVVGCPRFEIYRTLKPTREEARRALGLETGSITLLFCGAGVSFEETSLLEELDGAIESGRLSADVTILYKPHPMRMARHSERPLDVAKLSHVRVVSSIRGLSELSVYPNLFAAADGIVSPFSTMVMEGALHGLPALCLGYHDPGHANHDWNRVSFNLHVYLIRHSDWAVICDERHKFIEKVEELLRLCGCKTAAGFARASAEMMARTGEESVAQRLSNALYRLLEGRDADDSFAKSRVPAVPTAAGTLR